MRRAWALMAALLVATGCLHVQTEVQTTRGPLVRGFERKQRVPHAGILAHVYAHWPKLTVRFRAYDLCRTQQVGRFADTRATESYAPGAGPALSSGLSITLAGVVLFLARGLFSDAPDTSMLDASGHYGASTEQEVTLASYVLMALGLPAIVTGGVGLLRSGRKVETVPVDEVLSSDETPCGEVPANGPAAFLGADGRVSARPTKRGEATWTAAELGRDFSPDAVRLSGKSAKLAPKDEATLRAFAACAQLFASSTQDALVASIPDASSAERLAMEDHARRCDALPGKPAATLEKALKAAPPRAAANGGPAIESWSQALAAYPPKRELVPGGADLGKLASAPKGISVHLEGVVEERVDENLLRLRVDDAHALLLVVPKGAVWNTGFSVGNRVEGIALTEGQQVLAGKPLPRLRAIWLRAAFRGAPTFP